MTYLDYVPKLWTFKDALKHYESIKPVRGTNIRPLITGGTGRRHKEVSICYDGKNTVSIKVYDVTVLSFFQDRPRLDEYVYVTPKYATGGCMKLAMTIVDNVLVRGHPDAPNNFYFRDYGYHQAALFDRATKDWIEITDGIRLRLRKWKTGAEWHLIERPKMYGYYANRKVLNEKRELVATFIKYTRAMAKMRDAREYVKASELEGVGFHVKAQDIWNYMLDEELWPQASDYILRRCVERCDADGNKAAYGGHYCIRPEDVSKYIANVIKAVHANEIFELREVRTICYNGNDQYVEFKGRMSV